MKFASAAQIENVIGTLNGVVMDRGHTFVAQKIKESVVRSAAVARGRLIR